MKLGKFSVFSFQFSAGDSVRLAMALIATLTLAGCRNPTPSRDIQGNSPIAQKVKSYLAAGVGRYAGSFSGTLTFQGSVMPVAGQLTMINAYRFVLTLQTADDNIAFILRRNWGGSHFLIAPAASYTSVAREIGEGFSLAFRRPEGPWTAAAEKGIVTVRYHDANANRFAWHLVRSPGSLNLATTKVRRPNGVRYVFTYTTGTHGFPSAMTMADSRGHYALRLRFSNNAAPEMARLR
jgi:hypothetical protein